MIFSKDLNLSVATEEYRLKNGSEDFGHLVKGVPAVMAFPADAGEVKKAVDHARKYGLSLTPRGLARSQSGQSLNEGGISLDMSGMKQIRHFDPEMGRITCEPGVTWREIILKTLPYGWMPAVVPLNLNLTVGGTLSVAGIGTSSHLYGTSASDVSHLQVVNAEGNIIECNREHHSEYFYGTLSNLGQCGVITSAALNLRKVKKNIRTFYLLYDDMEAWLEDQQMLSGNEQVSHMQGMFSANVQGLRKPGKASLYSPYVHWFYPLQLSFETDNGEVPSSIESMVKSLRYYKLLDQEEDTLESFSFRYESRFEMMKSTGAEQLAHPWLECILPASVLKQVLPEILKILPMSLGDGHRLIFISNKNLPKFFKVPEGEKNAVFAILPAGIPPVFLKDAKEVLCRVHDMLMDAGGKRYLSGWLEMMSEEGWKKHFGNDYRQWASTIKALDPERIFRSRLLGKEG